MKILLSFLRSIFNDIKVPLFTCYLYITVFVDILWFSLWVAAYSTGNNTISDDHSMNFFYRYGFIAVIVLNPIIILGILVHLYRWMHSYFKRKWEQQINNNQKAAPTEMNQAQAETILYANKDSICPCNSGHIVINNYGLKCKDYNTDRCNYFKPMSRYDIIKNLPTT